MKHYKTARLIFYNSRLGECTKVTLEVRNALYEVVKRHRKNVGEFRHFKSKKIAGEYYVTRIN